MAGRRAIAKKSPKWQKSWFGKNRQRKKASEEFNRAAVKALVNAFGPNVAMSAPSASTNAPLVSKHQVFDAEVLYLRIPQVREGLPQALRQAFDSASSSNKVKGLVLDLRYANGQEFAVAASVVDLFLSKEKPLLTVNGKALKSASKSDAITVPVAVLVNARPRVRLKPLRPFFVRPAPGSSWATRPPARPLR